MISNLMNYFNRKWREVADFGDRSGLDFCAGTFGLLAASHQESTVKYLMYYVNNFVCILRLTSYTKINETLSVNVE